MMRSLRHPQLRRERGEQNWQPMRQKGLHWVRGWLEPGCWWPPICSLQYLISVVRRASDSRGLEAGQSKLRADNEKQLEILRQRLERELADKKLELLEVTVWLEASVSVT